MARNISDKDKHPVATVEVHGTTAKVKLVKAVPTEMTVAQVATLRDALGQALREARKAQRKAETPKEPKAVKAHAKKETKANDEETQVAA